LLFIFRSSNSISLQLSEEESRQKKNRSSEINKNDESRKEENQKSIHVQVIQLEKEEANQ